MEIRGLKEKHYLIVILIVIFLLLIALNHFQPVLGWDENAYLSNGRALIKPSNYDEIFRFPLITYLTAGIWSITGENVFVIRLAMMLFHILNILIFFSIVERIDIFKKSRIFFTALFALNPLVLSMAFRVNTDVFGLTFMLLALLFFIKSKENNELDITACGFFGGLGFLARYPYGLAFGGIFLFLIFKRWKDSIKLTAGFLLALLIDTIIRLIAGMPNLYESIKKMLHITSAFQVKESFVKFMGNWWLCFGLLLLFFIYGVYVWVANKDYKKDKYDILWVSIITILLAFAYYGFIVFRKEDRFLIFFIPYALLFCAYGIINFPKNIRNHKFDPNSIKIIAIFFLLLTYIPFAHFTYDKIECDRDSPIILVQDYLRANANANDKIISNIWPYFGYGNNLISKSLWAENPEMMIRHYKPDYIILANSNDLQQKLEEDSRQYEELNNIYHLKNFKSKCLSIDIYAVELAD